MRTNLNSLQKESYGTPIVHMLVYSNHFIVFVLFKETFSILVVMYRSHLYQIKYPGDFDNDDLAVGSSSI